MISISDALEEIIKNYPFIEEGLSRDLINYSAFAREVKPQIEKRLYKNIKEGAIVIDVGINRIQDGSTNKLVGDVDYDAVSTICQAITPVPGGVGPVTIAMLMANTLKAYKEREVK